MTSKQIETMLQLQCKAKGKPLEIVEVPRVEPPPNHVLIRQKVLALNPVDGKMRDWGIGITEYPRVIGIEGAGVVDAVGESVTDFQPGDEVMAWEGSGASRGVESFGGAFQEQVVVPAHMVAKKPKNISLTEAASLPIGFCTAVSAVVLALRIPLPFLPSISAKREPPASILLLGGSSVVGAAAVVLLRKAYPYLLIVATSSTKHHQRVEDLGATHVIDYKSANVIAEIKKVSPRGAGVDVILDCVGAGSSQTDISDTLDPEGRKEYAAVFTGLEIPVPEGVKKFDASAEKIFFEEHGKKVIPDMTRLVEEGHFRVPLPVNVVGHGLEQVNEAMDRVMNASGEKMVVTL